MLEVRNLAITRGDQRLIDKLDFTLAPGTLLRIIGANGSGKTSLMRALCGLLAPAAGDIRWNGENIQTLREEFSSKLICIGHHNALKDELTPDENLRALCALSGITTDMSAIHQTLAAFGLQHSPRLPVKALSQGQRRRTALARLALCRTLPLWILDEPFVALDAAAVAHLQSVLGVHLANSGMIVMTTHQDVSVAAPTAMTINLDALKK